MKLRSLPVQLIVQLAAKPPYSLDRLCRYRGIGRVQHKYQKNGGHAIVLFRYLTGLQLFQTTINFCSQIQ